MKEQQMSTPGSICQSSITQQSLYEISICNTLKNQVLYHYHQLDILDLAEDII